MKKKKPSDHSVCPISRCSKSRKLGSWAFVRWSSCPMCWNDDVLDSRWTARPSWRWRWSA